MNQRDQEKMDGYGKMKNSSGDICLQWTRGGQSWVNPSAIRRMFTTGEEVSVMSSGKWHDGAHVTNVNYDGTYEIDWADGSHSSAARRENLRESIVSEQQAGRDIVCPACALDFCSECQGRPHQGSCESWKRFTRDHRGDEPKRGSSKAPKSKITSKRIEKLKMKPCPSCRSYIQKNGGCNHMTCQYCRHEFWWCCFSDYRPRDGDGCVCGTSEKPTITLTSFDAMFPVMQPVHKLAVSSQSNRVPEATLEEKVDEETPVAPIIDPSPTPPVIEFEVVEGTATEMIMGPLADTDSAPRGDVRPGIPDALAEPEKSAPLTSAQGAATYAHIEFEFVQDFGQPTNKLSGYPTVLSSAFNEFEYYYPEDTGTPRETLKRSYSATMSASPPPALSLMNTPTPVPSY